MVKPYRPSISFCTTCMGRLEHLKQTLPKNLADNATYPNCQFVVLNYGGEKDTEQWIKENFSAEIASGRLKYVSYPAAKYFHIAHAKNLAHRMADGEILCNLDADQFTGKDFASWLAGSFMEGNYIRRHMVLRHSNFGDNMTPAQKSSLGKIVLFKSEFEAAGGYDERIEGWGGDDTNLLARLFLRGIHPITIPISYAHGIAHAEESRFKNYSPPTQKYIQGKLAVQASEKSRIRSCVGKITRLGGHMLEHILSEGTNPQGFGAGKVYINFSEAPLELESIPASSHFKKGHAI